MKGITWGVEHYEAGLLLLVRYESKPSFQCPDDGSLLTWFDHHGNSYWTHNLFQWRLCSDFWIKWTDLIFHLLFFLYKLFEPCTGLQQLHKCTERNQGPLLHQQIICYVSNYVVYYTDIENDEGTAAINVYATKRTLLTKINSFIGTFLYTRSMHYPTLLCSKTKVIFKCPLLWDNIRPNFTWSLMLKKIIIKFWV